jgi:hypothetical protein
MRRHPPLSLRWLMVLLTAIFASAGATLWSTPVVDYDIKVAKVAAPESWSKMSGKKLSGGTKAIAPFVDPCRLHHNLPQCQKTKSIAVDKIDKGI